MGILIHEETVYVENYRSQIVALKGWKTKYFQSESGLESFVIKICFV